MQSVAPFSFIDSFIGKLHDGGQSQTDPRSLILKSAQPILSLIKGIEFLEFQPSEIVATVAIYIVGIGVEKTQISSIFKHTKKERFLQCMEDMNRAYTMSFVSGTMTSFPEIPKCVLEDPILSYEKDDSLTCAKRRRVSNINV